MLNKTRCFLFVGCFWTLVFETLCYTLFQSLHVTWFGCMLSTACMQLFRLCKHGDWIMVRLCTWERITIVPIVWGAHQLAIHNPINYVLIPLWRVTAMKLGLTIRLVLKKNGLIIQSRGLLCHSLFCRAVVVAWWSSRDMALVYYSHWSHYIIHIKSILLAIQYT